MIYSCKKYRLRILAVFLFLCISQLCVAQNISAKLDREQITLGEQVNLRLQVDNVDKDVMQVAEWFSIADTGNHIEVIRREKIDTVKNGNSFSYAQNIILTSFDSGRWSVPLILPSITSHDGLAIPVQSDSVFLMVNSVDVSQLQDFHGIKEVVDVKYTDYTWLYYLAGVLILLLLILLVRKLLKNRKKKPVYTSAIKGPPLSWALKQIEKLQQENLIQQQKETEYFTRLDTICRTYYDERTHANTHYLTARETFEKLRRYLQEEKDRASYYELNRMNDAVKFAKYKPSQEQADKAASLAKETLQTIEQQILNEQNQSSRQKNNV